MYEVPLLISNQIWLNNFLKIANCAQIHMNGKYDEQFMQKGLSSYLSYIKLIPWEALLIACWQACR